ncbi:MAG: hypothetical protein HGA31_06085 [Candidatus Moranbacteria bacterium]|nr:hypothetical protein [Candidatus Moranbacteria bacterium]
MKRYPPSYIARRLREKLPANLPYYLSIIRDNADTSAIPENADVMRTVYLFIVVQTIADKCADRWVPISIGDCLDCLTTPAGTADTTDLPEELARSPIVFAGLAIVFTTGLVSEDYFEKMPDSDRYLPTARLIEHFIE